MVKVISWRWPPARRGSALYRRHVLTGVVAASIGLLCTTPTHQALARPPENADPALAPWFEAQKIPGTTVSCCSTADGRPVAYRIAGDHYEVLLKREQFPWLTQEGWKAVDDRSVIRGQENPTGRAIAWVAEHRWIFNGRRFEPGEVMCLVLPPQS
jgi:hypothetical protein